MRVRNDTLERCILNGTTISPHHLEVDPGSGCDGIEGILRSSAK